MQTLNIWNFLATTLNLTSNEYKPYCKETSEVRCINNKSIYWKNFKRNLPRIIESRINKLLKSERVFNNSIATYRKALNNANFKNTLVCTENKKVLTKV